MREMFASIKFNGPNRRAGNTLLRFEFFKKKGDKYCTIFFTHDSGPQEPYNVVNFKIFGHMLKVQIIMHVKNVMQEHFPREFEDNNSIEVFDVTYKGNNSNNIEKLFEGTIPLASSGNIFAINS